MAKSLADIAPDDIIWGDAAPAAAPQSDWLTSAPRVALPDVDPADIDWWGMGRWRDRTLMESAQKTIGEAGNAVRRGLALSRLASEMEQPAPDPAKIIEIQREIAQNPPSAEFQMVMNDKATPQESWSAFTRNPVGVVNELMLDSLSSYASQMLEKAPARVAIGTGAGVAIGTPAFGVGAIPAGATGALAGFAQSGGAASYSLEMAGGILESLEKAGVNMGNPEELGAALQDEQRMQVAREFAQKKAIPVAAFDTVSALIAGRVMGAKPATVLSKLGKGMVETAIQSVLGMGGEAAGQLSQSGQITSIRQIGAEGLGEIAPGAIEIGVGTGVQALQGQQPSAPAPAAAPQPAPFTPPPAAETVVVEEVFGDATTAAAPVEEAPAAEPAINPEDFEVVEMPGETIVTEPPAAEVKDPIYKYDPKELSQRAKKEGYELVFHGDRNQPMQEGYTPWTSANLPLFTSTDPEAASWYGEPRPLFVKANKIASYDDMIAAARRVGVEGTYGQRGEEANIPEVRQNSQYEGYNENDLLYIPRVREELQRQGFDAVRVWDQLERDEVDALVVIGSPDQVIDPLSTPPAQQPAAQKQSSSSTKRGKRSGPATASPAINLSEDQAAALAAVAAGTMDPAILTQDARDAIAPFVPMVPRDVARGIVALPLSGRAERVLSYLAQQPAAQPARDPIVAAAVREPDGTVFTGPLHTNAIDASRAAGYTRQGEYPKQDYGFVTQSGVFLDADQARDYAIRQKQVTKKSLDAVEKELGIDTTPGGLESGAFALAQARDADQNTPAQRSRRRIKNMTKQSGAIDLSIVEDLVEYGKTIYRAGMTYAQWAAAMVKEFGQAVAEYLQQAFNRVVEAYQNSRFSDTTGAVGNVRPKAKPRQFEQKAKANAAVTEEAKAELGSEYIPITLEGTAEEAKALINESGLDAAEQRILDLSSDELTPSPIDFGIGLELTARLGAMGEHQRQARIVRIMSRRATSMGQTISVLAMLARLTPEGIVFYANQVIEQYIDTLPQERQQQIRTAQDSVVSAETEVKATRKTVAEDTIINGTQGGEKIQEKLKRRIKDKTQKQRTNVGIRSVLTSKATKAEATKQITQLLTESGISESEAGALATAITSKFYKVMDEARKSIAAQRKPKEPKLLKIWSKLVAKLNGEGMPDDDFVAGLSLVAKLPTMTPELGARLKDLTRQLNEAKGDQDMQLVLAGRIFEEIHSLVPVDFWVKVRAFSYIMMLFSPKTWIRNIGGNVIQFVANAGKDTAINVASGRASIFSNGKTGNRVKSGRLKHLMTPYYDVKRGFEWNAKQNPQAPFSQNLAAGIDHLRLLSKLTTQNKFEVADAKEVGRRIFSSKFMGMLETSLSIALGGPDRAFWKSALESSLANREARAKQMGEWTGRHTPEDIEGAIADAAGAIYQNANTISKEAAKWRSSLNRMSTKLLSYFLPGVKPTEQFGFGTALMAFTQVPGAIARAAISWSPLGLIINLHQAMNGILWKASNQRAGKPLDTREFAEAFTKALGGTGIYAAGYYLYAMGVITASQEDDDDVEAMRRALGMGQYRVNVTALTRLLTTMAWGTPQKTEEGDVILSYDWAQPLAITFAAGAELAKMVEQNDRNGIKKGLAAKAAMPAISLAAGAKSLLDLPLLSGLASFIDQLDLKRPESVIGAVARTVAGIPSMFVPQLVRQANQLLYDNTQRETRGTNPSSAIPVTVQRAFNQIAANTPGVADQFPPRLDVMGQVQERYQYVGWHWFNVLFNPALTSRVKTNPALQEAARLMDSTGETSQFPKQVKNRASINGQNIDLTNEQISAYQYYLGNYTASMMNWRMASPRYARLPDTEKVRIFAQDIEDVDAAVKSALFGHDVRRLTRRQRAMRNNLVNSPLGQSMPPR